MRQKCCLLVQPNIRYRQHGDEIIYHRKDVDLKCTKGWTRSNCSLCVTNLGPPGQCNQCLRGWAGENCSECAANFGPPGQCEKCLRGWTGNNCDVCALGWSPPDCSTCRFGFITESNCTECIPNGRWTGTVDNKDLTVTLSFTGETCSEVMPGKFTIQ